jgi:tricorn protease
MRSIQSPVAAALVLLFFASHAAATKLLRFPNVWHDRIVFSYAGDLWTVGTQGGTASRLTSNPGLELFGKFSPDGRFIAFTGQYGGDEQATIGKRFAKNTGRSWISSGPGRTSTTSSRK